MVIIAVLMASCHITEYVSEKPIAKRENYSFRVARGGSGGDGAAGYRIAFCDYALRPAFATVWGFALFSPSEPDS
jgi:hypothetical protein